MVRWRLAVPKGRIFEGVSALLGECGLPIRPAERSYRPLDGAGGPEVKILKPQNIPELVGLGVYDAGFSGLDWAREQGGAVEEVLDTGLDPVRIVAAAPAGVTLDSLRGRRILAATEYPRLAGRWLGAQGLDAVVLRTYGATEVFPPEDADLIVDNSATGETLKAHGLEVLDTLLHSTTRLLVSPKALQDAGKAEALGALAMLMRGVLEARSRVLLEMNVVPDRLDALVRALPAMKSPTVQPLHGGGFAVKVAVPRGQVPALLPAIRSLGATDILEYELRKVLP